MMFWRGCDDLGPSPSVTAIVGEKPSLEILHLMLQYGWNHKRTITHIAAAEQHGEAEVTGGARCWP